MNRHALHFAVAAAAAGALSLAHAAGCPWLGENVPYDAAADEPASQVFVASPARDDDRGYVFSEANFPAPVLAEETSAMKLAQYDGLEP